MWGFHLWRTVDGLWRVWPANDEVRFVWQAGLTDAAGYLDSVPGAEPVSVGGWTPDTMDAPTMDLTLRREDLSLRYFDPTQSLVLAATSPGESARIVRPAILPLAPALEALVASGAIPTNSDFALYEVDPEALAEPSIATDVTFGDEIRLTGYTPVEGCRLGQPVACTLITYWEVVESPIGERRFFLHVVDGTGELVAQDDRNGVPAANWQTGDIILQQFTLPTTAGEIHIGMYEPATGERLLTREAQDHFSFTP